MRQSNANGSVAYIKNDRSWEVITIKEDLLFVFKRLLEKKKITISEYQQAVKIILKQYS